MMRLRRLLPLRRPDFILVGGFLLAFLSALSTVLATWSSREVALREWDNKLTSAARMLAAHAHQSIGAVDLVIRSIADDVDDYGLLNKNEVAWVFQSRQVFDRMRSAAKVLPQIDSLAVVAHDGTVLNHTREYPARAQNLAGRVDFSTHADDPNIDLFISNPMPGEIEGSWVFHLARKIRSESGDMLGMVTVAINATYFSDFYGSIGHGVARVSLMRADGGLLARHELGSRWPIGASEPAVVLERLQSSRQGSIFVANGEINRRGFTELIAFDQNPFLPVAVSVSATRQQLLREWEVEAVKFVIEGGALTGILIAVTVLLSKLIRQLEKTRNDALIAVEAKTRFASNVSHELRTPMNVIIGGAHQLMQTALPDDSRRFASIVSSSAQQLMVLINDILDYSYYEARQFKIEPTPFELHPLIADAMHMAHMIAPADRRRMSVRLADGLPVWLLGDSGRIRQVLLNLLANAVKYAPQGEITLAVDYRNGVLALAVEDKGPGITAEEQSRIFEPFERGRATGSQPGTGLGLTISKKLIEAMNGKLQVESGPGKGSRFTVQLPAPEAAPADLSRTPGPGPAEDAPAGRLAILIAEDVDPSRMLLSIMLEKMGHDVVAVANGREAVDEVRAQHFDLVLMDLQMPELDGYAATREIRAMGGGRSRVRIVAVSANADLESRSALTAAGFDDALTKPVTPARLNHVVKAMTPVA